MDSETQLVERIVKGLTSRLNFQKGGRDRTSDIALGVGDDAAIIMPRQDCEWVLSCDAFLEGVHFLAGKYPADSIGYKALARATSDLAAVGATPAFFLLTLAFPAVRATSWLDEFIRGMRRAAHVLGIRLIGGDTTQSQAISISITVIGQIKSGLAVRRSGARPGDQIYVSGRLGRAQLGLEIMRSGLAAQGRLNRLVQAHLYPRIRLELGIWLAKYRVASAMMDLSDGLSADLPRLCAASGVGAHLWVDQIPRVHVPQDAMAKLRERRIDPLHMALNGGEDYELLFTVPSSQAKRLRRAPGFDALTVVGEITREKQILIVDPRGSARSLKARGWDPFHPPKVRTRTSRI